MKYDLTKVKWKAIQKDKTIKNQKQYNDIDRDKLSKFELVDTVSGKTLLSIHKPKGRFRVFARLRSNLVFNDGSPAHVSRRRWVVGINKRIPDVWILEENGTVTKQKGWKNDVYPITFMENEK